MELDWIIQEPIDFEYKQYLILDYVKKTGDKLEKFELYPAFQELTLLYTSAKRVLENGQFITLKREPDNIDDEILLTDLVYNTIRFKDSEEGQEILDIAKFASKTFEELFMVAKSLWSIINESISVNPINNKDILINKKRGDGFFYFEYENNFYVYQFKITKLTEGAFENKCYTEIIYSGSNSDISEIIYENNLYKNSNKLHPNADSWDEDYRYELIEEAPIFEISINQNFPIEGCLLSLIKRKVMNYVFQTVKLKDLKKL